MLGHFFGYGAIVQVIALVHFFKRRPDGYWLWIIFFGGVIGATAYLLVEALPDFGAMRHSMQGFSRRKRIHLLEALVLENPSAGNYEELGDLLLDEKKYQRARECFDRALGARTDSIDPFYKRGVCEFELAEWSAAVADLERVVRQEPKYAYGRAQSLLARSLAKLGRAEEASTAFERLTMLSTASESLAVTAQFYFDQGRFADARETVQTLLARRATMPGFQRRHDRKWLRLARKIKRASGRKPNTGAALPAREAAAEESNVSQGRALGR
jgi:hypothetical protein